MKKKVWIGLGILLVVGCIICLFVFKKDKSTISIDINPSFIVSLNEEKNIQKIKPINEDAKEFLKKNYKNNSLKSFIKDIAKKVGENYQDPTDIPILIHAEGIFPSKEISKIIEEAFIEENLSAEVIIVDDISKEEKALAKKYKVTDAKAAYISRLGKENKEISIDSLMKKELKELKNMKETGFYCPEEYTLDGDRCIKETRKEKTELGEICPNEYSLIDGVCYYEGHHENTGNYFCRDGATLVGENCEMIASMNAKGICSSGEYREEQDQCVDRVEIGEGVEYCRITPGEDLVYNGRCLGRKPTINGGCLGSDVVIDGWCYDTSPTSGYESEWLCPDGSLMKEPGKCYKEEFTAPTGYECEDKSFTLSGDKCTKTDTNKAEMSVTCEEGYTLYDQTHCIDFNKTTEIEIGDTCPYPSSRLVGNSCIIYEEIPALKG